MTISQIKYNSSSYFNKFSTETQGIILMLVASFFFAWMGLFVKLLSDSLGTIQIVFFRNMLGVLIIIPSMLVVSEKNTGGRFGLLVMRGLFGFTALCMYFYSISIMPLASAITFTKTAPVFTAILAHYLLKERAPKAVWFAVISGFLGILMILQPSEGIPLVGSITGIASGFLAGAAYTSIRQLREYYNPRTIILSFAIAGTIAPLLILIASSLFLKDPTQYHVISFIMPDSQQWFYLACLGFLATIAQYLMTKSYSLANASIVGTVSYSSLIFSVVFGLIAGDPFPTFITCIGIGMITVSGFLVSFKK